jgi:hypothetical protein
MDNIIKNPTFIAVVAGVITYTYVVWKKKQNKKNNKIQKKDKKEVIMAGVVALLVWFIVYGYLNYKKSKPSPNYLAQVQQPMPTYRLVQDISESPKSFTLMNPAGGIAFPVGNQNMPDLFIDQF